MTRDALISDYSLVFALVQEHTSLVLPGVSTLLRRGGRGLGLMCIDSQFHLFTV